MGNYSPTAEDLLFIAENNPEKFSSGARTLSELQNTLRNHGGRDGVSQTLREAVVKREYGDYLSKGNPPLQRSPIPPSSDADGDGVMDAEFAAYCPSCKAGESCCMTAGSITDADDSSRKVEWPIKEWNQSRSLYVIAKDVSGTKLQTKVKVKGEGSACKAGAPSRPGFTYSYYQSEAGQLPLTETELEVGFEQSLSTAMALSEYVPENVTIALMVIDSIFCGVSGDSVKGWAGFLLRSCILSPDMSGQLNVRAYPKTELSADYEGVFTAGMHTSGFSFSWSNTGTITGEYGAYKLTAEGKKEGKSGNAEVQRGKTEGRGLLGSISSMIKNFSSYVGESSPGPGDVRGLQDVSSGVSFELKLKLKADALKLEEKKGSPDLELQIAGFETSLGLEVAGTLDFIDLAAQVLLSPAGARLVQKVRAEAADKSHAVNAQLEAKVRLSAEGEVKFVYNSPAKWVISDPESHYDGGPGEQEFTGTAKIKGYAQILLHVEAEVWVASAEAGAAGSIHTGWNWEWKMGNDERLTRYFFEGVIASARGYMKTGLSTSSDRKAPSTSKRRRGGGTIEGSRKVELEQTGPQVELGSDKWADPSESYEDGAYYEISPPTVPKVTDELPPWSKF